MRKKLHYLLLLISPMLFAQLPGSLIRPTKIVDQYADYTGSIYRNQSYKDAIVIDEKSGTFDAKLRYNIYRDALEYSGDNGLYNVIKIPTVHVRIDEEYYYYCDFQSQRNQNREGYYVLLEMNDSYRIYKKYSLKVTDPVAESQLVTTSNARDKKGHLRLEKTYYLEENDIIMELPMKKKDFLAAFDDKGDELKNYMKKEKIRLKKEEDLIRVVSRYNALKNVDANQQQSLLSNRGRRN